MAQSVRQWLEDINGSKAVGPPGLRLRGQEVLLLVG
eukprot:CAMPEP_0180133468 /NCGR_PEP_ID=MMETSP0986-20121125/9562_1 /TAXON_ID=697907 /ORGANISM="non described non described, Strain CCMP2293" /LENGTH=35 /DNA_ID= /DNA_START= /DNA_END= /DNA_ORIENTATION=